MRFQEVERKGTCILVEGWHEQVLSREKGELREKYVCCLGVPNTHSL